MMKRVEIVWTDSGTFYKGEGWTDKDTVISHTKIGTVQTVGLLMHEDDDTVWLALSYDEENGAYFGVQAIHKQSIIERHTLRER